MLSASLNKTFLSLSISLMTHSNTSDQHLDTSLDGTVAKSSTIKLIGSEFISLYQLQPDQVLKGFVCRCGVGVGELISCSYPLEIQACPQQAQKLALLSRVLG